MKFQRLIQAVYYQPWSITHDAWMDIHRLIKPHLSGAALPEVKSDGMDFFGNALPEMKIEFDTATIPIIGTLVRHASLIEKACGCVSYEDIKEDLKEAMATPGVTKIRLVIDSPGGQCVGNIECAQAIAEAAQFFDVEAVSDGQICSAAYALAAGARRILITPSAIVGSVGAFVAIEDSSKAADMAGIRIDVIKDGDVKGAGIPGTALSPDQRDDIQRMVTKYADMFRSHVDEYRIIDGSNLNGSCFVGTDAEESGFVDGIISDIEADLEFEGAEMEEDCDDECEEDCKEPLTKSEQPIHINITNSLAPATEQKKKVVIKRGTDGRMIGIEEES
jgi:ClpP class serine protease